MFMWLIKVMPYSFQIIRYQFADRVYSNKTWDLRISFFDINSLKCLDDDILTFIRKNLTYFFFFSHINLDYWYLLTYLLQGVNLVNFHDKSVSLEISNKSCLNRNLVRCFREWYMYMSMYERMCSISMLKDLKQL